MFALRAAPAVAAAPVKVSAKKAAAMKVWVPSNNKVSPVAGGKRRRDGW